MVVTNLEGNNNKWNEANNNDTNYDKDHNNENPKKKKMNQELLRGLIFMRRRRLFSFREVVNLHEATNFIFIS